MKKWIGNICATVLIASAGILNAGEETNSKSSSPEFERMKTLEGKWKGKADMGEGPVDMEIHYRLIAGGSVLEERVFAGTPNEMVTMYYDDEDGKLALTHYCVMGNQPGMLLKASDDKTLRFDFDPSCGIDVSKESHMHALTLRFDDPNTLTSSCTAIIDGKKLDPHPTTLKRVQ